MPRDTKENVKGGGSVKGGGNMLLSMSTVSLVTLVLQNSALVLMTRYSRFANAASGTKPYHTSSLVINQEVLKIAICFAMLAYENNTRSAKEFYTVLRSVIWQWDTVKLSIPAALFTLQNWLLFSP